MFSGPVREVSGTRIFAREGNGAEQFVAYETHVNAPRDVAMILPLPIDRSKGDKALRFIDLSAYPEFFSALESPFTTPMSMGMATMSAKRALPVEKVGAFDASYVPTIADFQRLDPRFRLPQTVWEKLPQYNDWGFAVFQLRKGELRYHPMAFAFERANRAHLFFPTTHIHDGQVRAKAKFDHTFFCQPGEKRLMLSGWTESPGPASRFVDIKKSAGLVDPSAHLYNRSMRGIFPNRDFTLPCG